MATACALRKTNKHIFLWVEMLFTVNERLKPHFRQMCMAQEEKNRRKKLKTFSRLRCSQKFDHFFF